MGFTYANIKLINTVEAAIAKKGLIPQNEAKSMDISILVDSGAIDLCINEEIRAQLNLDLVERTTARLADGSLIDLDIVGPVTVKFLNRQTTVNAVVLPGSAEPLLGAIPLEGMDVIIDPLDQKLKLPPSRPNKPVRILSGQRR
ncbi:MAG: clan AA aspartic protease [Bacteroidota bacterium]|nr:clan AA aspartic protease [Bacteroidota bacterium]